MNPQDLLDLPDSEFAKLVDSEARGRRGGPDFVPVDDETTAALRHPMCADRWKHQLVTMKKSVEGQIAARKSDVASKEGTPEFDQARRDYHRWRAGVMRFRHAVEERIAIASSGQHKNYSAEHPRIIEEERNQALRFKQDLVDAIRMHRKRVEGEYDPTPADRQLWQVLDDAGY